MDFTHSDEQRQELVAGISVGVVGGGTMGVGIAHRFAVRGATVRLVDLDFEAAEAAVSRVVVTLDTAAHRESHEVSTESIRLSALLEGSRVQPIAPIEADPEIRGTSIDSRSVEPGNLFCAIRGYRRDGARPCQAPHHRRLDLRNRIRGPLRRRGLPGA